MKRPVSRRPLSRRLAAPTVLAACALALTACSGSTKANTPSDDETPVSPLEKIFADVYGEWDEAEMAAQQMRSEEIVAACMAEQGFEYTPVDYSQQMVSTNDVDTTTREWAEKNGYAMTIQPEEWMMTDEEAASFVDPNQEYIDAMSESEQQAYYAALYGDFDWEAAEGEEIQPDPSQLGCSGKAQEELYGGQQDLFESEEMTAFNDAMTELWESIDSAPELADLNTQWSACMAEAGFSGYESPQAAIDDFMERSNSFYETAYPDDVETIDENFEEPVIDPKIQDEERATAVADWDCQKKLDYVAARQKVQFAMEQDFIDAHGPEIETYKAALKELGL